MYKLFNENSENSDKDSAVEIADLLASSIIIDRNFDQLAQTLFREIDCEDGGTIDATEFYN